MPETVLAWDVETCPLPDAALSGAQRRRLDLAAAAEQRRDPALSDAEARRRAASLHPMLGFVCCLSAVRLGDDGRPRPPVSYVAPTPADEPALLGRWWADLARLPAAVRFVTFNGKRFDCDWLRVRSLAHGLRPARRDVLDTYPYRARPHADLARAVDCACSLDDLCGLLGVARSDDAPPPDGGPPVGAATVAEAVAAGRLGAVAHYCEADVVATLDCYARLTPFL